MRILVTGAGGMLGRDLCDILLQRGHTVIRTGRSEGLLPMDVTDTLQTKTVLQSLKPEIVIHCAAWTDVDGAERDSLGAYRGNTLSCWNIATGAAEIGAWLVAVSTDFVFDGKKREPYTEFDTPHPISVYGASKWAGEKLVREILPEKSIVVRTSWLYGAHGKSFPATILRLAQKLTEVPVVTDEIGSPTHTVSLSKKIGDLIEAPMPGTYHICDAGSCSRYEMAQSVTRLAGYGTIIPITAAEYAARFQPAANRPRYSVLRRLSLEMRQMDDMPQWDKELADFIALKTETS